MANQKKKKSDEKQKSLFSYVDKGNSEVVKVDQDLVDDSKTASSNVKIKNKPEEIEDTPVQNGVIKKVYMEEKELNFGFNEKDIKLESVEREAVSSKYIRYLIEAGEIVDNLKSGLLLDVDYDGGQNKAYCKFYDLDSDEIKIWIDTTNHEPYCLSKESINTLNKIKKLTGYSGFERFEEIKKIDLLTDEEISITRIYGKTPSDIGGSGNNIKNILAENEIKAWVRNRSTGSNVK